MRNKKAPYKVIADLIYHVNNRHRARFEKIGEMQADMKNLILCEHNMKFDETRTALEAMNEWAAAEHIANDTSRELEMERIKVIFG